MSRLWPNVKQIGSRQTFSRLTNKQETKKEKDVRKLTWNDHPTTCCLLSIFGQNSSTRGHESRSRQRMTGQPSIRRKAVKSQLPGLTHKRIHNWNLLLSASSVFLPLGTPDGYMLLSLKQSYWYDGFCNVRLLGKMCIMYTHRIQLIPRIRHLIAATTLFIETLPPNCEEQTFRQCLD